MQIAARTLNCAEAVEGDGGHAKGLKDSLATIPFMFDLLGTLISDHGEPPMQLQYFQTHWSWSRRSTRQRRAH